ncbi:MAG: hypothetical protein J6U54_24115 [Clostridiales bacterium]|nr:hypothetical protein [Clostridiales bacterium]
MLRSKSSERRSNFFRRKAGEILDSAKIRSAKPVEEILGKIINTQTLNVLLDTCSFENTKNVLEALSIYICRVSIDAKLYMIKNPELEEKILEEIYALNLDNNVITIDGEDPSTMLSYIMGCDVSVSDDRDSVIVGLAKEFYLPRVCIGKGNFLKFEDGIFNIDSKPLDIASAFMLIREREHRDELSGHKRLA